MHSLLELGHPSLLPSDAGAPGVRWNYHQLSWVSSLQAADREDLPASTITWSHSHNKSLTSTFRILLVLFLRGAPTNWCARWASWYLCSPHLQSELRAGDEYHPPIAGVLSHWAGWALETDDTEKEAESWGHPTGDTRAEDQLVTSGKVLTQGSREHCVLRREVWSNLSDAPELSIQRRARMDGWISHDALWWFWWDLP